MNNKDDAGDIHLQVAQYLSAIEIEMKKIGLWSSDPLPAEAYNFQSAFAMDTMAFSQWLQFIFIPRVKEIIHEKGQFPSKSMVATQALREFGDDPQTAHLIELLIGFDGLFHGE